MAAEVLRCDASCVVLLCRSAPRRKTSLVEETPHDVDGGRGHDGRQRPTCHDVVGIAMRENVTAGAPAGASSNVNLENPSGGKDSDEMQRRTWTKGAKISESLSPGLSDAHEAQCFCCERVRRSDNKFRK